MSVLPGSTRMEWVSLVVGLVNSTKSLLASELLIEETQPGATRTSAMVRTEPETRTTMQPTPAISLAKSVVPSRLTIEPLAYSGQRAHGTGSGAGAGAGCVVGGVDPPPPPVPPPPRAKAGPAETARVAAVMAAATT